jgi:hypothetical protein
MVKRSPSFNLSSRFTQITVRNRNSVECNDEPERQACFGKFEADLRMYGFCRSGRQLFICELCLGEDLKGTDGSALHLI